MGSDLIRSPRNRNFERLPRTPHWTR
jgi:hypothetical protein